MACQNCTIQQTEVCKNLSDLKEIYIRISQVQLFLQRFEIESPVRSQFSLKLKDCLQDFSNWFRRFDQLVPVEGPLTFELVDETYQIIENFVNSGNLVPEVRKRLLDRFSWARDALYLQVEIGHE